MDHVKRFEVAGAEYARYRPGYPNVLMDRLAQELVATQSNGSAPVLDVGAGTGIFARQLSSALGSDVPVVCVEPSADMRGRAANIGPASVRFTAGVAEKLPAADASVRGVTAATAAHWFDRTAFYGEAERVLLPGGVLAIIEYVRDVENSAAPRAVEDFLEHHGDARAYRRPDYPEELRALTAFGAYAEMQEPVLLSLAPADFVGLALSSSHARAAIETMGRSGAEAELLRIAGALVDSKGRVSYGYRFQLFMARRNE